jgi:hypothetical protein
MIVNGYAQYEDKYTAQTFLQFTPNGSNTSDIIFKNGIQRELIYEYSTSGKDKMDSTLVAVIFYDETGTIFEKWKGVDKDKLVEKYSYGVDSLNRPAILKIAFNDPASKVAGLEVEYDTLGREVNMYQYNSDTTYLVIRHKEYNSQGHLAGLYTKVNNDSFYHSHQYLTHGNGQLQAIHMLVKNEALVYTYKYLYDTTKRSIKVMLVWEDETRQIGHFVYDANSRLVQVTVPNPMNRTSYKTAVENDFELPHYFHRYLDRVEVSPAPLHTFYIYNPDGTLFESHVRNRERGGKVSLLKRHYYTR